MLPVSTRRTKADRVNTSPVWPISPDPGQWCTLTKLEGAKMRPAVDVALNMTKITPTIKRALRLVTWEYSQYTTNKGRSKAVAYGIPTAGFWKVYKREKAAFTSLPIQVKPDCRAGCRRQWGLICWQPELLNY